MDNELHGSTAGRNIPVRVLHVIAPAPFGGAETAVLGLVSGLAGSGVSVTVAIMADARSGPFVERARSVGAAVEVLDSPARNYLRDLVALRRIIRSYGVTILHSHGYRADVIGGIAAAREGVRHVATAHGFTGGSLRNRLNQFFGMRALRHADAVIAVSAPLAATLHLRGVRRQRIHQVVNAWVPPGKPLARDAARGRLALPAEGHIVGWVGRLSHEKGPDLALQAFAQSAADLLVMVGDGPLRESLVQQAAQLGITSRIRWAGTIPDVWEVLPAFDLLLLSSRTEGTPMILLEAMHALVPVVATPVGGVPVLVDEDTGWLASDPSATAISDVLKGALEAPATAAARAAAAVARVRRSFDRDAWIEAHHTLYATVQAGKATGRS